MEGKNLQKKKHFTKNFLVGYIKDLWMLFPVTLYSCAASPFHRVDTACSGENGAKISGQDMLHNEVK